MLAVGVIVALLFGCGDSRQNSQSSGMGSIDLGTRSDPAEPPTAGIDGSIKTAVPGGERPSSPAAAAYDAGDYARAGEIATKAAQDGDAQAQTVLGKLHYFGKVKDPTLEEAVRLWAGAAEKGDAEARTWLAFAYRAGHGVQANPEKALSLLREAAAQSYAPAQERLAVELIDVDPGQALSHLRSAAAQNYPPAQRFLGTLYRDGRGVAQDLKQAFEWLSRAAAQDDSWAQLELGQFHMKPGTGFEDVVEAYKWIVLAASKEAEPDDQIAMDAELLITLELRKRVSDQQIAEARKRAAQFLKERAINRDIGP